MKELEAVEYEIEKVFSLSGASSIDYQDLICQEILATDVQFGPCRGVEWDLNGEPTVIAISKGIVIGISKASGVA